MPITISSLLIILFFFFFCLSMHTCHARHLGVKVMNDDKKLLSPSKVLGRVELKRDDETVFHANHATEIVNDVKVVKPKDKADDNLVKELVEQTRSKTSSLSSSAAVLIPAKLKADHDDVVSVPGRTSVAKANRMNYDERSGFLFSDYSRPRTRPPSHN